MEETSRYLEEEKLSKLMLKFSIPCVLSMLVGALYNIEHACKIWRAEQIRRE